MNTDALTADMAACLGKLESMHAHAASVVGSTWAFPGAGNSSSAAKGAVEQYGRMIAELGGMDRSRVLAQTADPSWWMRKAEEVGHGLAYTVKEVGNWGMSTVTAKWLTATWSDVGELAPTKTEAFGALTLVVLLVAGLVVLRFTAFRGA